VIATIRGTRTVTVFHSLIGSVLLYLVVLGEAFKQLHQFSHLVDIKAQLPVRAAVYAAATAAGDSNVVIQHAATVIG
jgi:hypothetical protein